MKFKCYNNLVLFFCIISQKYSKEIFFVNFSFFAKNGPIFFVFREKFQTRKMCSTKGVISEIWEKFRPSHLSGETVSGDKLWLGTNCRCWGQTSQGQIVLIPDCHSLSVYVAFAFVDELWTYLCVWSYSLWRTNRAKCWYRDHVYQESSMDSIYWQNVKP